MFVKNRFCHFRTFPWLLKKYAKSKQICRKFAKPCPPPPFCHCICVAIFIILESLSYNFLKRCFECTVNGSLQMVVSSSPTENTFYRRRNFRGADMNLPDSHGTSRGARRHASWKTLKNKVSLMPFSAFRVGFYAWSK